MSPKPKRPFVSRRQKRQEKRWLARVERLLNAAAYETMQRTAHYLNTGRVYKFGNGSSIAYGDTGPISTEPVDV